MRTKSLVFFLAVFLFMATFPTAGSMAQNLPAEEELEKHQSFKGTVAEVVISGNRRTETSLIDLNIETKQGDEYSPQIVKEDLKRIFKLDFFQQVLVDVKPVEDGLRVEFVVEENPVLADLKLSGNDKLKEDDIKEAVAFREGRIVSLRKITEGREIILALASEKGLVGTEVEYEIEPRGDGVVDVVYRIDEGERKYIKEVELIGNSEIETKKIRKNMYSKPKYILSFITKRGLFKIEEIKRDSDRIKAVYIDNGYLDVKVSEPGIRYDEEKDGYVVSFSIEEGVQYRVSTITFSGELAGDQEEIRPNLELLPDSVFSSFVLQSDIGKITDFYGDKGYAFANVTPDVRLDKGNNLVSVDYSIEKGKEVYVRNINILDNTRTRDHVVRRELSLQEQSLYSVSKLRAARYEAARLGYFEENIEVLTHRVEGTDDLLDVDVKVEERPTGFFSFGGGVSSVENFLFSGQIQESNLFGYGKTLSLDAQVGGVTKALSLNYRDPYFFGTNWLLDISLYAHDRDYRDFERAAKGISLGVGRRIKRNFQVRVFQEFSQQDVHNVRGDALFVLSETERTIVSTGVGLSWDTRNNYLDPTKGFLLSTAVEYAGLFAGNTDFIKYNATAKSWIPFWKGTYFAAKANYGLLHLIDAGDDLVVEERFFLGGPNTLRGFRYRRVGPRRSTDTGGYVIIGGVQQVLASLDFVVPLSKTVGLKAVAFFDIGNAFDQDEFSLNPSNLRKDAGFGIRWISPLGPMKLDIGFPIGERLRDEEKYEVQFTIGNLF
ncbi:MAG: outer membrane protein assembly factor BamA [Candidatus Dadabacteria bacterium]|nr:outer membrane protein assembly factor BamA [Candidatus Dadabacteria bacterium]MDE0663883.1 outer membrane protein assembly factor BamA [Candidatus Dadabacteria bacterium]